MVKTFSAASALVRIEAVSPGLVPDSISVVCLFLPASALLVGPVLVHFRRALRGRSACRHRVCRRRGDFTAFALRRLHRELHQQVCTLCVVLLWTAQADNREST